MHATRSRVVARSFVLAVVIGALAAACSGSHTKPAPTATPAQQTPAAATSPTASPPTPTATKAPADPKVGDQLRYEGQFEAAADVYAAVAGEASGDRQQAARLAQAQLLTRAGRTADARAALDAYVAAAGASSDGGAARYMLASALDDLGDTAGAIDSYQRYIAAGGVLIDFARVERAKLLARLGRVPEAEAAAREALAGPLLPAFKASFLFSMGRAFEQGQADASALAWYALAKQNGDTASALARIGAVKKRLADPTWIDDYAQAVADYPESGAAADLLDALDAAGVPVDAYARGLVDYRSRRDTAARTALAQAIAADDHAALATYYVAAIDERAGDLPAAIAGYQRAHDLDPASPLADSALWWRGKLLEQAGRYDEAGATYGALVSAYPASQWLGDANFHRGLALYRAQKYPQAALVWSSIVAAAGEDDALRARFWQGRALVASGDAAADAVLSGVHNDAPASFYGLRAEVLLKKNDGKDHKAKLNGDKPDWGKIAKYLQQAAQVDVSTPPDQDPRWAVASALRDVGLNAQSEAVARATLSADSIDIARVYADLRASYDAGQTSMTARAAATLIASLPDGAAAPPDALLRLAYPAAYGDLTSAAAKQQDISPTLLLALVRQESFYDPDAGSGAGALGLTQVVPSTGEAIATDLGVAAFSANDLYRPRLSLEFGASYLADQLKQFDGDPYHALAAYNGGPGTASNAIKSSGEDEDLFVEDLEFDETQRYVRLVMENYARYRQLYEGVGRASLPR